MSLLDSLKREKRPNKEFEDKTLIERMKETVAHADAVLIGAGSGLSTSAGLSYNGKRFEEHFSDYIKKYGMEDMYSAGFYPFATQEEKWAYWSRHIFCNRYELGATKVYQELYDLVKAKNFFVLTTNVDHQFSLSGFPEKRIFATQGDYGLFQCSRACHKKLYDNEAEVRAMIAHQKDCKVPKYLVPKCPVCGGEMEVNLRCDSYFVEDDSWNLAAERYTSFLEENRKRRIVFLELGVGMNTPGIIKYPFWRMTNQWENSFYICINKGQAWVPDDIKERSMCLDADIKDILQLMGKGEEDDAGGKAGLSGKGTM